MKPGFRTLNVAAALTFAVAWLAAASPAAGAEKVLVLSPTVASATQGIEATSAAALGLSVDVVDPGTWSSLSAADFAGYRAIVIGGPRCTDASAISAAAGNVQVWGPQIDGNVIVIGTDPITHADQGGQMLAEEGVAFASARGGRTGAYIALNCHYHDAEPGTRVSLLDGLSSRGDFTVRSVGCFNDAHVTAYHPALGGLADVNLSRWICSVYEAFDSWPDDFVPLAVAAGAGSDYTAADGTVGPPYMLVRGEGVVVLERLTLAGPSGSGRVGKRRTVSATLEAYGAPVPGVPVRFDVVAGPHAGRTGEALTRRDGTARFSYSGTAPGTDWVVASFVDPDGHRQRSNAVTLDWTAPALARAR